MLRHLDTFQFPFRPRNPIAPSVLFTIHSRHGRRQTDDRQHNDNSRTLQLAMQMILFKLKTEVTIHHVNVIHHADYLLSSSTCLPKTKGPLFVL